MHKPREDIKVVPLENSDLVLFVDGNCFRDTEGNLKAAYGACTLTDVVEASFLAGVKLAQVAEIIALTRACAVNGQMPYHWC